MSYNFYEDYEKLEGRLSQNKQMYLRVPKNFPIVQTDHLEYVDIRAIDEKFDRVFTISDEGEFLELIIDEDKNFQWEKVMRE